MLKPDAFGRRHAGDRGDLIEHEVFGFLRRHVHVAASEADEIRKTRVRANRHAVRLGRTNRGPEHGGVAGVEPGGDIRRGDGLQQAGVVTESVLADRVGAERFADVRVEVDPQAPQCTKQKGIA